MELQDEVTTLRDALQQIDDWGTDELAALFGLDDVASVPPSHKRRRRHGRHEAEKLKRIQLQQQLAALERERALCTARHSPLRFLDTLWAEVAVRQRDQRFAAEVANNKLRAIVAGDYKASCRLSALARKVNAIATALGSSPTISVEEYRGPREHPQAHARRLGGFVSEALAMFGSSVFTKHAGRDFRDVTIKNVDDAGLVIEMTAGWVLPFPLQNVVDVLWFQTTRMPRKEKTSSFQDIYTVDRTLVSRFVSKPKQLGTIDSGQWQSVGWATHGQLATQWESLSPGGAILMVSSMIAHNYHERGSCQSLLEGSGFLLVEPLETLGSKHGGSACRVQWCRHLEGRAPDRSAQTLAEYSKWAEFVTSRVERKEWWSSIEQNVQAVENTLLDAALSDHSVRNA